MIIVPALGGDAGADITAVQARQMVGSHGQCALCRPVVVCVEPSKHSGGQLLEHEDLVAGEPVEKQAPDHVDVTGRGGFDRASAGCGQDDERTPAVLAALLPADEPTVLHPVQVVRQPTLFPLQTSRELEWPQASVLGVGELHEHLVVGERQAAVGLQLPVEAGSQLSLHLQVGPPDPLLTFVEPSLIVHAIHSTRNE